jgi:hypothetical protein
MSLKESAVRAEIRAIRGERKRLLDLLDVKRVELRAVRTPRPTREVILAQEQVIREGERELENWNTRTPKPVRDVPPRNLKYLERDRWLRRSLVRYRNDMYEWVTKEREWKEEILSDETLEMLDQIDIEPSHQ